MAKEEERWIRINMNAKKRLGLTYEEYALCTVIHNISSRDPEYWCKTRRKKLSTYVHMPERSMRRALANLKAKDLIQYHPNGKYLRTTLKWVETVKPNQADKHFNDQTSKEEEVITPEKQYLPH